MNELLKILKNNQYLFKDQQIYQAQCCKMAKHTLKILLIFKVC